MRQIKVEKITFLFVMGLILSNKKQKSNMQQKTAQKCAVRIFRFPINENRIRRPILVTFELGMVHLRTQGCEHKLQQSLHCQP